MLTVQRLSLSLNCSQDKVNCAKHRKLSCQLCPESCELLLLYRKTFGKKMIPNSGFLSTLDCIDCSHRQYCCIDKIWNPRRRMVVVAMMKWFHWATCCTVKVQTFVINKTIWYLYDIGIWQRQRTEQYNSFKFYYFFRVKKCWYK